MTSPHLTALMKNVDPVDALRLLVADLQALAERLGLKEQSRGLQRTLKTTQERVFGPRTVVMLLSESAPLKRRFLERLLGPELAAVPEPVAGCLRLEHGAEADCTVTMPQGLTAVLPLEQLPDFLARRGVDMPQQQMQTVRLPNTTLARGLAVIDTPVVTAGEPPAALLEATEQADAWIFVLGTDHALSEASLELLRTLPESALRLDMVVEGAESLSGEARLAAREQLVQTLRTRCNIAEPRLTLLASPAAEGEEGSFWHGRFATFQSVMMLRGRERWLETSRAVVADALADVALEIDFELKGLGLGLRQARLRLGMKDLDGLRNRFRDLGLIDGARPREVVPQFATSATAAPAKEVQTAFVPPAVEAKPEVSTVKPLVQRSPLAPSPTLAKDSGIPEDPSEAVPAATVAAATMPPPPTTIPPVPLGQPTYVGFQGTSGTAEPSRRGVSVHLSDSLARLVKPQGGARRAPGTPVHWRVAGYALAAAALLLMIWAVWPHSRLGTQGPAEQWSYTPSQTPNEDAGHATPNGTPTPSGAVGADLPPPVSGDAGPDMTSTEAATAQPQPAATPTATGTPARTALPHDASQAASKSHSHRVRRRRRGFLGLSRLWHWMRRDGQNSGSQNNGVSEER